MKKTFALVGIIIFGFPAIFAVSRFLEANQTSLPPDITESDLTLKAETLKKFSFGFEGLIADYYWMSSLQYVGQKIIDNGGLQNVQLDNLKPLNPRLLYPMLDTATTLDPDFTTVYSYGATVLPAINVDEAIKLVNKGIAAQPDNWRLYHQLGYIYWKNNDYQKAAGVYDKGATKPNAPAWMLQMSAYMQAQGGSRETARAMYEQMYETAQDGQMRELALKRLLQLDSFDERDAIRTTLQNFQTNNNRCPDEWPEVITLLRASKLPNGNNMRFDASGSPVDPSNAPYLLINKDNKCDVDLDWKISKIPYS